VDFNDINIRNLQSFHKKALIVQNKFCQGRGFFMPKDDEYSWPQFLFTVSDEMAMLEHELIKGLKELNWPVYAIVKFENEKNELIELLRHIGFMPLERWPMMYLEIDANYTKSNDIMRKVDTLQLCNLINEVHFSKKPLTLSFFNSLEKIKQCKTYGMFSNDEIVAGCVTYGEGTNSGIYMMATNENARGNGWGQKLITSVINDGIKNNIKSFTLQATEQSKGFYEKMGFILSGYSLILVKTSK